MPKAARERRDYGEHSPIKAFLNKFPYALKGFFAKASERGMAKIKSDYIASVELQTTP